MRKQGVASWVKMTGPDEIEPAHIRFLENALAQPWTPRTGKVLEIGCGTAPLLRWFEEKGYRGVGIDVSKTALQMARAASKGRPLRFVHGDVCTSDFARPASFDICIDGLCLHCIVDSGDRTRLLKRVASLLRPGGLFIVTSMCKPVNKTAWQKLHSGQRLVGNLLYTPYDNAGEYVHSRAICGRPQLAIRYVAPWKSILAELRAAGFTERLIQVTRCTDEEVMSNISVAATIEGKK
jgi:SAM-dependent methyltransferase